MRFVARYFSFESLLVSFIRLIYLTNVVVNENMHGISSYTYMQIVFIHKFITISKYINLILNYTSTLILRWFSVYKITFLSLLFFFFIEKITIIPRIIRTNNSRITFQTENISKKNYFSKIILKYLRRDMVSNNAKFILVPFSAFPYSTKSQVMNRQQWLNGLNTKINNEHLRMSGLSEYNISTIILEKIFQI